MALTMAQSRLSCRPFTAASTPCFKACRKVVVRAGSSRISPSQQPAVQEQTSSSLSAPAYMMAAGLAMTVATSLCAEPALADTLSSMATQGPMEQFQLAEGQEFWGNVARYGRYFITVMLGTGYVMLRPLAAAFKNPVKGVLALAGVVGLVVLVKLTLDAMLGITDEPFTYVQGQF